MKLKYLFLPCLFSALSSMKIDRVILSSDSNCMYLDFWPLVSQAWWKIVGIRSTLILISDEFIQVDETFGDVIRLPAIKNLPDGNYAQIIRLLAPVFFEDQVCLLSDIDMLPLRKEYFVDLVRDVREDAFVLYTNLGYSKR